VRERERRHLLEDRLLWRRGRGPWRYLRSSVEGGRGEREEERRLLGALGLLQEAREARVVVVPCASDELIGRHCAAIVRYLCNNLLVRV
jgi:hypothetical protein